MKLFNKKEVKIMAIPAFIIGAATELGKVAASAGMAAATKEIMEHGDEIACAAVDVVGTVICTPLEKANDFMDWLIAKNL